MINFPQFYTTQLCKKGKFSGNDNETGQIIERKKKSDVNAELMKGSSHI